MHKCVTFVLMTSILSAVYAVDLEERANQLLHPRQTNCVPCPVNPPACPVCPSGQECQIMSQSCNQCAISQCIPTATLNNLAGNTTPPPVQSNTAAIAGGIAGALVFLLLVAGSLFYWRRKKRVQVQDLDAWLSSGSMEEKGLRESISTRGTDVNSSHHSIAETTMTRASNIIPIGYQPSPLRNTMLSCNTDISNVSGAPHDSLSTIPSHPPTQFFSADDILRSSLATNVRDTRYTDTGTVYSIRDTQYTERNTMCSDRDSIGTIGTAYTRASVATNYRATAIIATAPVPVQVRAQPKIITFGKAMPAIPAVPELTAEKVAEAERSRATMIATNTATSDGPTPLSFPVPAPVKALPVAPKVISVVPSSGQTSTPPLAARLSAAPRAAESKPALRLSTASPVPAHRVITPTPMTPTSVVRPRLSRISTFDPLSKQPLSSPFEDVPDLPDDMPESPILGEADSDSFLSASKTPTPDSDAAALRLSAADIQIIVTPTSSISPSLLRDPRDSVAGSTVSRD